MLRCFLLIQLVAFSFLHSQETKTEEKEVVASDQTKKIEKPKKKAMEKAPKNTKGSHWAQNPCQNERYLELKEKKLDEMSQREYEYFLRYDEKCYNRQAPNLKKNILNGFEIGFSSSIPVILGEALSKESIGLSKSLIIITPAGMNFGPLYSKVGLEIYEFKSPYGGFKKRVLLFTSNSGLKYKGYGLGGGIKGGLFPTGYGGGLNVNLDLPFESPLFMKLSAQGIIIPHIYIENGYTGWVEAGINLFYNF